MHHGDRTWVGKASPHFQLALWFMLAAPCLEQLGTLCSQLDGYRGTEGHSGLRVHRQKQAAPQSEVSFYLCRWEKPDAADRAKNANPWGEHLSSPQGALDFIPRLA